MVLPDVVKPMSDGATVGAALVSCAAWLLGSHVGLAVGVRVVGAADGASEDGAPVGASVLSQQW